MTDEAWVMLSEMADSLHCNRSEVLERLIRRAITWDEPQTQDA